MSRHAVLGLVALAALLAPAPARAQHSERLRQLQRDTAELRADVGESYRRLMGLTEEIFGDGIGARVTISQESRVDPFFRLVQVTYALDGQTLMTREGADVVEPLEIYDGAIGPGDHTLSVVLRYVGEGHGVIGYLPGYRFTMRSAYQFTAPSDGRLDLTVRPFTRDATVPYTERLGIRFEADERENDD